MSTHREWLAVAVEEARQGLAEGGIPIGSALIRDGQVVGRGHNRRVQEGNPIAHAEIDCLERAGRQRSYRDTILVSTLMPCHLCAGAAVQFGIPKVIAGESRTFPGARAFLEDHGIEVIDLEDEACIGMMTRFIRENPELWNEDIGR